MQHKPRLYKYNIDIEIATTEKYDETDLQYILAELVNDYTNTTIILKSKITKKQIKVNK